MEGFNRDTDATRRQKADYTSNRIPTSSTLSEIPTSTTQNLDKAINDGDFEKFKSLLSREAVRKQLKDPTATRDLLLRSMQTVTRNGRRFIEFLFDHPVDSSEEVKPLPPGDWKAIFPDILLGKHGNISRLLGKAMQPPHSNPGSRALSVCLILKIARETAKRLQIGPADIINSPTTVGCCRTSLATQATLTPNVHRAYITKPPLEMALTELNIDGNCNHQWYLFPKKIVHGLLEAGANLAAPITPAPATQSQGAVQGKVHSLLFFNPYSGLGASEGHTEEYAAFFEECFKTNRQRRGESAGQLRQLLRDWFGELRLAIEKHWGTKLPVETKPGYPGLAARLIAATRVLIDEAEELRKPGQDYLVAPRELMPDDHRFYLRVFGRNHGVKFDCNKYWLGKGPNLPDQSPRRYRKPSSSKDAQKANKRRGRDGNPSCHNYQCR